MTKKTLQLLTFLICSLLLSSIAGAQIVVEVPNLIDEFNESIFENIRRSLNTFSETSFAIMNVTVSTFAILYVTFLFIRILWGSFAISAFFYDIILVTLVLLMSSDYSFIDVNVFNRILELPNIYYTMGSNGLASSYQVALSELYESFIDLSNGLRYSATVFETASAVVGFCIAITAFLVIAPALVFFYFGQVVTYLIIAIFPLIVPLLLFRVTRPIISQVCKVVVLITVICFFSAALLTQVNLFLQNLATGSFGGDTFGGFIVYQMAVPILLIGGITAICYFFIFYVSAMISQGIQTLISIGSEKLAQGSYLFDSDRNSVIASTNQTATNYSADNTISTGSYNDGSSSFRMQQAAMSKQLAR